jgi:two-component system, OmpR family, alkaline phosphatase synthesis response regulator PhoP
MPGTKREDGAKRAALSARGMAERGGGCDALHGLRWWQFDLSAYIIRELKPLGLAHQVWRIPTERWQARSRIIELSRQYSIMGPTRLRKATSVQRTGSILVIDQESTIVDLLIEILTDAGYVAYSAPDGARALAAIARYPPALLLLDIQRPDMDGAALIAQVREVELATMPIVVMTTAPRGADPLLVSESIECLAKPFDLDDLLACVARYVQPSRAANQRLVSCAS